MATHNINLRHFPELRNEHNGGETLWYLGGNLHIGEGNGCERQLVEMGFNRVFGKVRRSCERSPGSGQGSGWHKSSAGLSGFVGTIESRKPLSFRDCFGHSLLESDTFERSRREVLQYFWNTGRKAKNLHENGEFLCAQPSFPRVQALLNSGQSQILVQPRSGVPLIEEQIKLFKAFKRVGVRVLSYQVDSLTRNNNYTGVEEALRENAPEWEYYDSNGFPIVNHGVLLFAENNFRTRRPFTNPA